MHLALGRTAASAVQAGASPAFRGESLYYFVKQIERVFRWARRLPGQAELHGAGVCCIQKSTFKPDARASSICFASKLRNSLNPRPSAAAT
jgi:hypothetical protein